MDPNIDMNAGLASVAAARLIEMLSADGWSAVKNAVRSLWRHSHPERVEAELAEARGELLKAEETGGGAELQELLVAEWQARLARLVATRPDVVEELRTLLLGQPEATSTGQTTASMTQEAHVSGGGDAYLAGRDMKITKGGPA
jgi:hypothetical protein